MRRSLVTVLVLALAASCGTEDPPNAPGGTGGASQSSMTHGAAQSTGTFGEAGHAGQGGGACARCPDAYQGADSAKLCADSKLLYEAVAKCVCKVACVEECAADHCAGYPPGEACKTCMDPANIAEKCPEEVTACVND